MCNANYSCSQASPVGRARDHGPSLGSSLIRGRKHIFRGHFLLLLLLAPILALAAGARQAQETNALVTNVLLTNLSQLHGLSLDEGAKGFPVKVRATVTYCDSEWRMLFVQDETGSVFVSRSVPGGDPSWQLLYPGQVVEFECITQRGAVGCSLKEQSFRIIGPGPMPAPLLLVNKELFTKANDARWAKVTGLIYSADFQGKRPSPQLAVL